MFRVSNSKREMGAAHLLRAQRSVLPEVRQVLWIFRTCLTLNALEIAK